MLNGSEEECLLETPCHVLEFFVNGKKVVNGSVDPETSLLTYLRKRLGLTGSKLGCGEGGCGACTVMISKWDHINNKIEHYSANACLAPVVSVHGCAVTTVEGIGSTKTKLHAVQERLAKFHGSQCGFCTPGIVMSMYALLRNKPVPSAEDIEGCLQGNLCRCTGYRPILSAFQTFSDSTSGCPMGTSCCKLNGAEKTEGNLELNCDPHASSGVCFSHYDPTQEIIFPPELLTKSCELASKPLKFVGERITWFRPTSLDELTSLRKTYPDSQLVNGNTEIGVETGVKGRLFKVIVNPSAISKLKEIVADDKGVKFGAACTLTQIKEELTKMVKTDQSFQTQWMAAFLEMLHWFAGDQIRNVAAIGGNTMTASPISDLNPILMANESMATFRLHSRAKDRQVLMDQSFFPKYRTTCAEKGEVLISVFLPFNAKDEYMKAYKQSKRREDDIAIVNAAMRVVFHPGTCKVLKFVAAFGGMAATSVMPEKTMQNMIGREWKEDLVDDFSKWISEDLFLDKGAPGGMVEYREALVVSFFFKFFLHVKSCRVKEGAKDVNRGIISKDESSALEKPAYNLKQFGTRTWQEVPPNQPEEDKVGRDVQHVSGIKHTTGEAVYVDDIPQYKDELYLAHVISTRAHAFIRNVDIQKAMMSPGFVTYLDDRDVPGTNTVTVLKSDEQIFAKEKVTCVGQIIGAVVADSQAHAQRAAQLVQVEYEDIDPVIITIKDAIKHKSYFPPPVRLIDGDADVAMETCDHVIEGEISVGGQEHFYMETQAALALPVGEDGEMEIFSATQDLDFMQRQVAASLNVERNKIRVRCKRIGGGFGGKQLRSWLVCLPVAVAANKCGKPVRCMLPRKDDMLMTGGRHPFYANYKVGFMNSGKVQSIKVQLFSNCGHTYDHSVPILSVAVAKFSNAYNFPNIHLEGIACKTNVASNTAFRGYGGPQGLFVAENLLNNVAEYLTIPQEKIREINMLKSGDITCYSHKIENPQLRRCWDECLAKSDFYSRKTRCEEFNKRSRWRKRGLACIPLLHFLTFPHFLCQAGALVNIYTDGSVSVTHGGTEMGQGLHTKIIQIAGRCLGIPVSRIHISETTTASVPNASATVASISSDMYGMAVQYACDELMRRLNPIRKQFPELDWNNLINKAYMNRVSLSATGFYNMPGFNWSWNFDIGKIEGNYVQYYTNGAAVSEVEVDCLTGVHVVLQTDIVMDVGRSLNPAIDIGQIEGGFVQGYGMFTMEEPLHTPSGHLLTVGPGAYKIPGFGDCPRQFNVHLLRNSENDKAIYSSKGIGEPPLLLACVVFFAIENAVSAARKDSGLFGSFRLNSPATAESIRMACGDKFSKQHEFHKSDGNNKLPWSIRA